MFLPTFVISKCCLDFNHIFPKCRDFTREFCCIKQLNPCPLHVCQFVFQLLSPQMFAPFLSCFVVIGSQPWNIWNMGFVGKSETIFCFQRWLGNFQISYDLAPVSQSVISEGRCPQMPISKMSKLFLHIWEASNAEDHSLHCCCKSPVSCEVRSEQVFFQTFLIFEHFSISI